MPRKDLTPPRENDAVESLARRIHRDALAVMNRDLEWDRCSPEVRARYVGLAQRLLADPPQELNTELHSKLLSAAERIYKQSELLSKKAERK